jgi:hypothetical protein
MPARTRIRWCGYCGRSHKCTEARDEWGWYRPEGIRNIPLHRFQYGKLRPVRFKQDRWQNAEGDVKFIRHMSKIELVRAIRAIRKGWRVFGQAHKIISLEKELAQR